jgi:hypothetical protein
MQMKEFYIKSNRTLHSSDVIKEKFYTYDPLYMFSHDFSFIADKQL